MSDDSGRPSPLHVMTAKLASLLTDCPLGLVVKASASRAEDPRVESRLRRDFSGSSHTSDLKIETPVATMPGARRYWVSAGTGRPAVSMLWLGEVESLIATSISVWQHVKLSVQIRPWDLKTGAGIAQLVVLGLAVHSVAGSILLWGNFPVEGIFPLELTWVQTPFPPKLFRMRV